MTPVLTLAQEVFEKLRDVDSSTADSALKIAGELLGHRRAVIFDMQMQAANEEIDRIRASQESDAG